VHKVRTFLETLLEEVRCHQVVGSTLVVVVLVLLQARRRRGWTMLIGLIWEVSASLSHGRCGSKVDLRSEANISRQMLHRVWSSGRAG
jgi:hypothetical protein